MTKSEEAIIGVLIREQALAPNLRPNLIMSSRLVVDRLKMVAISKELDHEFQEYEIRTDVDAMMELRTVAELAAYVKELMSGGISFKFYAVLTDNGLPRKTIVKDDSVLRSSRSERGLEIDPADIMEAVNREFKINVSEERIPEIITAGDFLDHILDHIKELL